MNAPSDPHERLTHFPVALFASVMGVARLTIAWLKAAQTGVVPEAIGGGLRWLGWALLSAVVAILAVKTVLAALAGRICVPE